MTTIEAKKPKVLSYETYEELRNSSGLTDADVSEKANIARSTISEWKNGRSEPKFEIVLKLCGLFGVPIEKFVKEEYQKYVPNEQS